MVHFMWTNDGTVSGPAASGSARLVPPCWTQDVAQTGHSEQPSLILPPQLCSLHCNMFSIMIQYCFSTEMEDGETEMFRGREMSTNCRSPIVFRNHRHHPGYCHQTPAYLFDMKKKKKFDVDRENLTLGGFSRS